MTIQDVCNSDSILADYLGLMDQQLWETEADFRRRVQSSWWIYRRRKKPQMWWQTKLRQKEQLDYERAQMGLPSVP